MKILFVTSATGVDYESDCVFHGMVDDGHDVVDSKYLWYLSEGMTDGVKRSLYGKGFTIAGNLPDRTSVDRSGIEDRIASHEFDMVVYGSIHRGRDYFDLVKTHYNRSEIAVIDGEDHPYILKDIADSSVYFKRELYDSTLAKPISFAIPESKFMEPRMKTKVLGTVIPGNQSTYVFDDEESYYRDYAESMYGLTFKKAGWDCMRHYEIIAAGCMPLFTHFEQCPKTIMMNWPWYMQSEANRIYNNGDVDTDRYTALLRRFVEYARSSLTTRSLSRYIIESMV